MFLPQPPMSRGYSSITTLDLSTSYFLMCILSFVILFVCLPALACKVHENGEFCSFYSPTYSHPAYSMYPIDICAWTNKRWQIPINKWKGRCMRMLSGRKHCSRAALCITLASHKAVHHGVQKILPEFSWLWLQKVGWVTSSNPGFPAF